MLKPCLVCGEPSDSIRCDEHRREAVRSRSSTRARKTNGTRWKRFSARLRAMSPFCEFCGSGDYLTVDHVLPYSERPDLEYTVENCRILCRSCNSSRGNRVTDAERAEVEARLTRGARVTSKAPLTTGKAESGSHLGIILNKGGD